MKQCPESLKKRNRTRENKRKRVFQEVEAKIATIVLQMHPKLDQPMIAISIVILTQNLSMDDLCGICCGNIDWKIGWSMPFIFQLSGGRADQSHWVWSNLKQWISNCIVLEEMSPQTPRKNEKWVLLQLH